MAEFLIGVRKQFLQEDRKCVVVSHDWGALICARLAAEAGELADRWVTTSGIIVSISAGFQSVILISIASRDCSQRFRTVDFGTPDAAHVESQSLEHGSSQERSPGAQASHVAIQKVLLHLLLSLTKASGRFLHHMR